MIKTIKDMEEAFDSFDKVFDDVEKSSKESLIKFNKASKEKDMDTLKELLAESKRLENLVTKSMETYFDIMDNNSLLLAMAKKRRLPFIYNIMEENKRALDLSLIKIRGIINNYETGIRCNIFS